MGFSLSNLNPFSDHRDDDRGTALLNQVNAQNTQAYGNYDNLTHANQALNSQVANTNYFGNAQNVYGQQQQAASMLQNQANGTAPSAAQIQMLQGLGAANQQAQAAAQSQQGGVLSGNTQRNMLNAQAMNGQSVIGSSAAQRATDQLNAQNTYASMLGGMQTGQQNLGNLQLAQQQFGLQNSQQMNQQNLQNAQGTADAQYSRNLNDLDGQTARNNAQAGMISNVYDQASKGLPGMGGKGFFSGK